MAPANRPNKDKRQRRNRAMREARAARSARAGEATAKADELASRVSDGTSAADSASTAPSSDASTAPSSDASKGPKDGKSPSGFAERRAVARERVKQRYPIPGQRAVFLALMFSFVFAGTMLISSIPVTRELPPTDERVIEDCEADDECDVADLDDGELYEVTENTKLLDEEEPWVAATVLLLPTAITGGAYWFTKRPRRTTVWTMAMFIITAYVLFAAPYSIFALPSMIAMAVGSFQSRRADNAPRLEALRREREERLAAKRAAKEQDKGDGGDVIDAEVKSEE